MTAISFANSWYWFLLGGVVSYFVGCFNFAVLIGRFKHKDIRHEGSGNPGTMNMTRTLGLKFGAINFFLDVFKGGIPALIGWIIFKNFYFEGTTNIVNYQYLVSDFARYFFGLMVIIGHVFPVTMKFKGGKGIASTMGLFLFAIPCDMWWYFFIAFVMLVFVLVYIIFSEMGSMGSLLGVSGLTIFQAIVLVIRYSQNLNNVLVIIPLMLLFALNVITWAAHHKNIWRLLAGEEHHTSVRKHKKRRAD